MGFPVGAGMAGLPPGLHPGALIGLEGVSILAPENQQVTLQHFPVQQFQTVLQPVTMLTPVQSQVPQVGPESASAESMHPDLSACASGQTVANGSGQYEVGLLQMVPGSRFCQPVQLQMTQVQYQPEGGIAEAHFVQPGEPMLSNVTNEIGGAAKLEPTSDPSMVVQQVGSHVANLTFVGPIFPSRFAWSHSSRP